MVLQHIRAEKFNCTVNKNGDQTIYTITYSNAPDIDMSGCHFFWMNGTVSYDQWYFNSSIDHFFCFLSIIIALVIYNHLWKKLGLLEKHCKHTCLIFSPNFSSLHADFRTSQLLTTRGRFHQCWKATSAPWPPHSVWKALLANKNAIQR